MAHAQLTFTPLQPMKNDLSNPNSQIELLASALDQHGEFGTTNAFYALPLAPENSIVWIVILFLAWSFYVINHSTRPFLFRGHEGQRDLDRWSSLSYGLLLCMLALGFVTAVSLRRYDWLAFQICSVALILIYCSRAIFINEHLDSIHKSNLPDWRLRSKPHRLSPQQVLAKAKNLASELRECIQRSSRSLNSD